ADDASTTTPTLKTGRQTRAHTHLFFFSSRRRHTRSLRDWSSDVCLPISFDRKQRIKDTLKEMLAGDEPGAFLPNGQPNRDVLNEIGRASCRERVESAVGGVSGRRKKKVTTSMG